MIEKAHFTLHVDLSTTGRMAAADVVILEDDGSVERVGFRYRPEYVGVHGAVALDPVQLPLQAGEFELICRGGLPAFLDDYLPDDWGRRVLSYAALLKTGKKLNARSAIACLKALRRSRVGAIELTAVDEEPLFSRGVSWEHLSEIEEVASQIDRLAFDRLPAEALDMLYLANEGSGAGGARPKALIHHGQRAYLAKFNRQSEDAFNYARVEGACLRMAREAGLEVYDAQIAGAFAGRDILLLDRFDVAGPHRRHLVTVNGLRKDYRQRDDVGVFRYDDIHALLQSHSVEYLLDAQQLLRVMLFNRAINNTDDHERNFSLINDGTGYRLSPAYDLVPNLTVGTHHVAGFGYSAYPPTPNEARTLGRIFGLSKSVVGRIADEVATAIEQWPQWACHFDVSEQDTEAIRRVLRV